MQKTYILLDLITCNEHYVETVDISHRKIPGAELLEVVSANAGSAVADPILVQLLGDTGLSETGEPLKSTKIAVVHHLSMI